MNQAITKQTDNKPVRQESRQDQLARSLKGYLTSGGAKEVLAAANEHIKPERFARICLQAAQRNPMLLEVEPPSMLKALLDCAALGLEPKGRGGVWLVPFKNNKRGCWEVQVITDYRGEIALARRSGEIKEIETGIVYENDTYKYQLGDNSCFDVWPCEEGDPGKPKLWFAIAKLKDGGIQRAVLTRRDVDKARSNSRSNGGPWKDHFDAMAIKTAVRRLCNLLPMPDFYDEQIQREREQEERRGDSAQGFGAQVLTGTTQPEPQPEAQGFTATVEAEAVEVAPEPSQQEKLRAQLLASVNKAAPKPQQPAPAQPAPASGPPEPPPAEEPPPGVEHPPVEVQAPAAAPAGRFSQLPETVQGLVWDVQGALEMGRQEAVDWLAELMGKPVNTFSDADAATVDDHMDFMQRSDLTPGQLLTKVQAARAMAQQSAQAAEQLPPLKAELLKITEGDQEWADYLWGEHVGEDTARDNPPLALKRAKTLINKAAMAADCRRLISQIRGAGGEVKDLPGEAEGWTIAVLTGTKRDLQRHLDELGGDSLCAGSRRKTAPTVTRRPCAWRTPSGSLRTRPPAA